MNAMTPLVLTGEQPSSRLTRLDVSDLENVKDARHQLRRCQTERQFADWAATWGENLCNRAEDANGREDWIDPAEAARSEEEAVRDAWNDGAADARAEMRAPMRKAVKALREIVKQVGGETGDALEEIADTLSTAAEARA